MNSSPFCEGRYLAHQPVEEVAELANALSSAAMFVMALVPVYSSVGVPIYMAKAALALCGVGSVWYHTTMSFEGKLFDEFPMIFIATFCILSACLSMWPRWKAVWSYMATVYLFTTLWLDATRIDPTENAFRVMFCLPFVLMMAIHAVLYARKAVADMTADVQRLYRATLAWGTTGCVAWIIDLHACTPFVAWLRLHAVWHVCIAYTAYCLLCLKAVLEGTSGVEWILYGGLPVIRKIDTESEANGGYEMAKVALV